MSSHEGGQKHSFQHLLTLAEVARELRCSKAHVSKAIRGMVRHASQLPAIHLGRRRLVRRETLYEWIRSNENTARRDKLPKTSEIDAARRIEGGK
jgi:excisionase family DNA binding protein